MSSHLKLPANCAHIPFLNINSSSCIKYSTEHFPSCTEIDQQEANTCICVHVCVQIHVFNYRRKQVW